jgi:ParB/RepB/Spo0J family partition protein
MTAPKMTTAARRINPQSEIRHPKSTEGLAQTLPIKFIVANPLNPRKHFDREELQKLAGSIKEHGVLQPVLVRPHKDGRFELIAGERRYRAAMLAGEEQIPAIIRDLDDRACIEVMVIENEQRSDVSPLEKATGYALLIEKFGMTSDQVAARVGKSVNTIRDYLKLRGLSKLARDAVESGTLPATRAAIVARVPSEQARQKLTLHILAGDRDWRNTPKPARDCEPLSRRDTKDLVREHCMRELKQAPFDRLALDLVDGAGTCQDCPSRAGNAAKEDPEAFADVRGDVCLDPTCFDAKLAAWQARQAEEWERQGFRLLAESEASGIFADDGAVPEFSRYIDLETPFVKLTGSLKSKSLDKVIDKVTAEGDVAFAGGTVIAIDARGRPRKLAYRREVTDFLSKAGVLPKRPAKAQTPVQAKQVESQLVNHSSRLAAEEACRIVADDAESIFAKLDDAGPGEVTRLLALTRVLLQRTPDAARTRVAHRRELADIVEIDGMTPSQALGLAIECLASTLSLCWGDKWSVQESHDDFWQAFGIDREILLAEFNGEQPRKAPKAATAG